MAYISLTKKIKSNSAKNIIRTKLNNGFYIFAPL